MGVYVHPKRDEVVRHQRLARLVVDAEDLAGLTLILRSYLDAKPMAFEGRCLLRRIQIDRYDAAESFLTPLKEQWNRLKLPLLLSQAEEALEKEPKKAVALAEDILSINPYDEHGNRILVRASRKLGLPKLAVLALETVCRHKPNNVSLTLELAAAYQADRDFAEARALLEEVLENNPGHAGATEQLAKVAKAETAQAGLPVASPSGGIAPTDSGGRADYEPREMCYSVLPLLDPLGEDSQPVRALCSILEPIEDHLAMDAGLAAEWFQWIETELGTTRLELEEKFASDNEPSAEEAIRLGYLRAAFLELPEAREAFDLASVDGELEFAAYSGMTACLMHEGALIRHHEATASKL